MRNIKIVIEYDGAEYYGWQRQKGHQSIQQTLEERIKLITKEEVTVIGSGRTDTGVHAVNQVAHFKMCGDMSEENLLHALNCVLPNDIVIKELDEVHQTFHARFDVKSKRYIYQIWNGPSNTAIHRRHCWYVRKTLDLDQMRKAVLFVEGTHDFSAFCGAGSKVKDYIRTVFSLHIDGDEHGKIVISVTADGFLRHMVRNLVGTLVDVGKGKISLEHFKTILDSRDRKQAGMTAPAHGLFLAEVTY